MNEILAQTTSVPEVSVSWLAISLAFFAAMAIGNAWYGPLFGKKWMKIVKLSKKDAEKNWKKPMAYMVVLALVQAYILSHFVAYSGYFYPDMNTVLLGAITGFFAFAGFSMPVTVSSNMFARRSDDLIKIELGNQLVTLVVIGAIIGALL